MKKRTQPEDNSESENDSKDIHEMKTAPLFEGEFEEQVNQYSANDQKDEIDDEVEDITNSIITQIISEDELIQLKQELEEAQKLADENLDGWQRARAEFANYKKRIERERADDRDRIKGEIIFQFLGAIDDLERALKERPEYPEYASWSEGIDLIYRKMKGVLESEGVEFISADGENFDPNYHEAISHEESSDHESGKILEVLQQGYKIGDRVIRPAVVRVAK